MSPRWRKRKKEKRKRENETHPNKHRAVYKLYMVRPRVIYNIEINDNFYYMHFRLNLRNKTVDYLCAPILLFVHLGLFFFFPSASFSSFGPFVGSCIILSIPYSHTKLFTHKMLVLLVAWHGIATANASAHRFYCTFSHVYFHFISFRHCNSLSSLCRQLLWVQNALHKHIKIILSTLWLLLWLGLCVCWINGKNNKTKK